ncbi:PleD family two-component system response regulator [Pedobacter sp. SYP-B3415]|uniref:response regulator n=1 Tax=Pedobacter sp. SYP-B3415 TaxID=2496641 RepID=UPI00101D6329|nr:response regulator [Pedobacter sp. SYP-B3415]
MHSRKLRVLLIDDDYDLREFYDLLFESEDIEGRILELTNDICAEALDFDPHVALIDYHMPGKSGGELCAELKNNPATSHIPVMIFTADPDIMPLMPSFGSDFAMEKPFEIHRLIHKLHELAGR